MRYSQFRTHEVAANGSSSREGCSASCSTIWVERCQFHESASQGFTSVDGLRSYKGKALLGYFQPDGIAGGKDTGGGLELDLPVVNGIRGVALLAKKIRRARDADADKISLTVGAQAHEFPGEVGVAGRGDCVELELRRSEYVDWFGQGRTGVDQEVVA